MKNRLVLLFLLLPVIAFGYSRVIDNVAGGNTSTSATPVNLITYAVPEGDVGIATVEVLARSSSGVHGSWVLRQTVKRLSGGNVVLVSDLFTEFTGKEVGFLLMGAPSLSISGGNLLVQSNGLAGTTITWDAVLRFYNIYD